MTINANRRTAMYTGVASLAALAGAGVAWKRQAGQDAGAIAPDVMQAFWAAEFDTPTGESLPMASFQGRPLVINFWATWCTPCVEEMPLIDAFFRENKEKLPAELVSAVEEKVNALRGSKDKDDMSTIKTDTEALSMELAKVYDAVQKAGATGGTTAGPEQGGENEAEGNVRDAEVK